MATTRQGEGKGRAHEAPGAGEVEMPITVECPNCHFGTAIDPNYWTAVCLVCGQVFTGEHDDCDYWDYEDEPDETPSH